MISMGFKTNFLDKLNSIKFKSSQKSFLNANNTTTINTKQCKMTQLENQKYLYDRAFEFIKTGLERENNDKLLALDYYLKGLKDLNEALNLKFSNTEW
jgi:hypothetical protein